MKQLLLWIFLFVSFSAYSQGTYYKTRSGAKYHYEYCQYVKNKERISITLTQACQLKLDPCKKCKPTAHSSDCRTNPPPPPPSPPCTSVQCHGTTKKGQRCRNKTRNCNGYCYAHNPSNYTDANITDKRLFLRPQSPFYTHFFHELINPLVELSKVDVAPDLSNSGTIFLASCLPSSTPHWSKL